MMMHNEPSRSIRELEAALGLLKLNGFQASRYSVGRQIRKTRLQTCVLHRVFEISKFPSTKTILDLALLINIHPKSIQKWFQNTRQTLKKRNSMKQGGANRGAGSEDEKSGDNDDFNIIDIPVPILADIVEVEKKSITRTNV
jgi:hypothetical protein